MIRLATFLVLVAAIAARAMFGDISDGRSKRGLDLIHFPTTSLMQG